MDGCRQTDQQISARLFNFKVLHLCVLKTLFRKLTLDLMQSSTTDLMHILTFKVRVKEESYLSLHISQWCYQLLVVGTAHVSTCDILFDRKETLIGICC